MQISVTVPLCNISGDLNSCLTMQARVSCLETYLSTIKHERTW